MRTTASVVIVGAGIVGCSAAFSLARRGWRDVVVVEQGPLFATGGSSSHAPGLVFQTNGSGSEAMTQLARRSVALYSGLELDGRPCFHSVGSLEVAQTPERWADLRRKLGWARSWGLEARLVDPGEAARLLPLLDPAQIRGAYHVPSDGIAKAVRAAEAMARAAGDAVEFRAHTPTVGIEVERGRVRAVATPGGRIATERVLVCAGIWGPRVGRLAGVAVPLVACQHQYARSGPLPELAGATGEVAHPVLRAQDLAMYARQEGDRYGVGSYAHEPMLVDPDEIRPHAPGDAEPAVLPFTPGHFARPWAAMADLLPALRGVEPEGGINGLFSFTPDGFPLLGEAAETRGLWLAEAVWVTHGGGVGEAVADWLTDGRPGRGIDLRECDANRFEAHARTRAYVRARGAQQYREIYDIVHPSQPIAEPRPLRRGPFRDQQRDLGAVFFEARGWERPQWYGANGPLLEEFPVPARAGWAARHWSPIAGAEHLATRARAGLFDLSSLPTLEVSGPGAAAFLGRMVTNRVDRPVGSVAYALLLDEGGGVRSDVTVARLGEERFQIGCNGPLDLAWLRRHLPGDGSVAVRDVTGARCCLGLWGPRARDVLGAVAEGDVGNGAFPYFAARELAVGEVPVTALRVSYVGELGWELYAPAEYGGRLWDLLWGAGRSHGLVAAGRAAFETLRLEKGYRAWGTDVHAGHTPAEAGLGFAVKPGKGEFVGRDAVLAAGAPARRLACLTLDGPGVMGKEPILAGDRVLGHLTSAGYGFSVGCGIAYGYLPAECMAPGTPVEVEYFGERLAATVAREPLFDPEGARLRA